MPKVYNRKDPNVPKDAIYVGRPTVYGNPFHLRKGASPSERLDCVRRYRQSLSPSFTQMVRRELRGKDLVCWCAPEACHADVLMEIANEEN